MKKKRNSYIQLLVFIIMFLASNICFAQNKQWEMYNRIPSLKSIELKFDKRALISNGYGEDLRLIINSDYTVDIKSGINRMCLNNGSSPIALSLFGNGLLVWKSEKMVLQLNITESTPGGTFAFQRCYERTNYFQTADQCDNYEYTFSSTKKSFSCTFDVEYGVDENGEFFKLSGDDITLTINGREYLLYDISNSFNNRQEYNRNYEYKTTIKIASKPIRFTSVTKSSSEINAENSDIYGKWQWNTNRSYIYLKSSTEDAYLALVKTGDNNWVWGFVMNPSVTGYKTESTETGETLDYMMLSFDGSSDQSFTFLRNEKRFFYVQYDRFIGKLKYDSSILEQIKGKRVMIVNYRENGSNKTAMFQLEGLEAIYNAIKQ